MGVSFVFCGKTARRKRGIKLKSPRELQNAVFSAFLLNGNPVFLAGLIPSNPRVQLALMSALFPASGHELCSDSDSAVARSCPEELEAASGVPPP